MEISGVALSVPLGILRNELAFLASFLALYLSNTPVVLASIFFFSFRLFYRSYRHCTPRADAGNLGA